jgi:bifunctional DNase/RNase
VSADGFTKMSIYGMNMDLFSSSPIVILKVEDENRYLPIWIGQAEAESIVIEMSRMKRERPLTHDLCKNLIIGMGGSLRRVHITKVHNRTFYAELHIAVNGGMVHIDARPSDSIAIALRFAAPIFAQASLLTAVLVEDAEGETSVTQEFTVPSDDPQRESKAESLKQYLENLRPEDFGKFNM